jgi:hypothetical protein
MARSGTEDDDFERLVGDLHRLDDTELLLAWKGVREALDTRQPDFAEGHRLRFRHYAFRTRCRPQRWTGNIGAMSPPTWRASG